MSEQVMVQVRFKEKVVINGNETEYNDALYFTQAEYQAKSQSDINSLKQERVTNWVSVITTPPPIPDTNYVITNQDGTVTYA